MKVSVARKMDEVAALESAWEELAQNCGSQIPGSNPLWIRKWFEHVGARTAPLLTAVWENGQLAGIAPLAVKGRLPGMRVLTPAGSPHGALLDFPAKKNRKREVFEKIASEIAARRKEWDICDIADLAPDSLLPDVLIARSDDFLFAPSEFIGEPFFSIALQSNHAGNGRSRKHKYNLRRSRKKLAGLGKVDFKIAGDMDALAKYMPQIFEIHERRWQGYYTGSLFNTPGGRTFTEEIAKLFLERGHLYLALLTLNERAVAYALCFRFGCTLYYYNPAFDPEFAVFSPGSILLEEIIGDCRQQGISRIELGKGCLPYKERLATSLTKGKRIIFAKRGPMAPMLIRSYLARLSMRETARRSEFIRKVAGQSIRVRRKVL